MRMDKVVAVLAVLALGTLSLHAEVVPGKWQKVRAQPAGTALNVELHSGERLVGSLVTADPTELVVETIDGERRMDASEVKKISLSGVDDSLKDGAIAGAVIGGLGGILLGMGFYATEEIDAGPAMAAGVALGAGIGVGTGLAIDKMNRKDATLYYSAK